MAAVHQDFDHVGQVILALLIVALDFAQRHEKQAAVEAVGARVDFVDLALDLSAILLLDDLVHGILVAAHDAPIARGVGHGGGQDDAGAVLLMLALDEPAEGLGGEQRGVAAGDEGVAREPLQVRRGLHHGVAGAEPLGLVDADGALADVRAHLFAPVTGDDVGFFHAGLFEFAQHVIDHRPPA